MVNNVSTEVENQLNKNGDRRGMHPNSRKNLEKRHDVASRLANNDKVLARWEELRQC